MSTFSVAPGIAGVTKRPTTDTYAAAIGYLGAIPALRLEGPAGHPPQLVQRQRVARGAQQAEAVDHRRLDRDPLPGARDRRRESTRDVLDPALLRRQTAQVPAQHLGVLQVATGALHGLGDETRI